MTYSIANIMYVYLLSRFKSSGKCFSISLVLNPFLFVQAIHFMISGAFWIGITHQLLDANKNLLDCYCRFPIMTDNGETYGTRGENVGMREGRSEYSHRRAGWIIF